MKVKLLFVLLFVMTVGFAQTDIDVHKGENYFIAYPKSWEIQKSKQKGVEFILFSKQQKTDPFRENINLVIQEVDEKTTLESYIELTESQMRNMLKTTRVSENTFDKIKDRHVLVYSVNVSASYLKVKQHFYKKGNKVYILTFTALQKSYDDYKKVADSVLDSFAFKPEAQ